MATLPSNVWRLGTDTVVYSSLYTRVCSVSAWLNTGIRTQEYLCMNCLILYLLLRFLILRSSAKASLREGLVADHTRIHGTPLEVKGSLRELCLLILRDKF